MTKILSFSCVEKLPALLRWRDEKLEWQTIRPAWNDLSKESKFVNEYLKEKGPKILSDNFKAEEMKPPRFEVGEKARIMWKSRSPHKLFCSICGEKISTMHTRHVGNDFQTNSGCDQTLQAIPKLFGIGTVTEAFKIEMRIDNTGAMLIKHENRMLDPWQFSELARRDGFDPFEEFFNFFNKNYDLSTPKPFYCYRGGWD